MEELNPSEISQVINKLWKLELFSDINFYLTNVVDGKASIEIAIVELPSLSDFKVNGLKRSKAETIIDEIEIKKGQKLTENFIIPNKCERTSFLPIFQPLILQNERTEKLVESVKSELKINDVYDLSYLKEKLTFTDFIHIDQKSKEVVANKIAKLIKETLKNQKNC